MDKHDNPVYIYKNMNRKRIFVICFLLLSIIFNPLSAAGEEKKITDNATIVSKEAMLNWVQHNFKNYFQKYKLSCEAAIIRLVCNAFGITNLSEDDILKLFPIHKSNPELGLVIEEIDGDVYNKDGSINWHNYGAHASVAIKVLHQIFQKYHISKLYTLELVNITDSDLKTILKNDTMCLGAIIWVAAYINKKKPPVNKAGQVLGEHVMFAAPKLDPNARFILYDVWPWPNQPFKIYTTMNRELFNNQAIIIRLAGKN